MGNAKATLCKVCGAPRYAKSGYALCLTHHYEHRRATLRRHYERAHPGAREYKQRSSDKPRRSSIKQIYARYGLQPGGVWKLVLDGNS